jgi:3-deoxy-D-manno-octulosonate 8-phosphate phosphatase KdsC-like HAD superfamily phosphatase
VASTAQGTIGHLNADQTCVLQRLHELVHVDVSDMDEVGDDTVDLVVVADYQLGVLGVRQILDQRANLGNECH